MPVAFQKVLTYGPAYLYSHWSKLKGRHSFNSGFLPLQLRLCKINYSNRYEKFYPSLNLTWVFISKTCSICFLSANLLT